jgi:hypothetical protein
MRPAVIPIAPPVGEFVGQRLLIRSGGSAVNAVSRRREAA